METFTHKLKCSCQLVLQFPSKHFIGTQITETFTHKSKCSCQLLLQFPSKHFIGTQIMETFTHKSKCSFQLVLQFSSKHFILVYRWWRHLHTSQNVHAKLRLGTQRHVYIWLSWDENEQCSALLQSRPVSGWCFTAHHLWSGCMVDSWHIWNDGDVKPLMSRLSGPDRKCERFITSTGLLPFRSHNAEALHLPPPPPPPSCPPSSHPWLLPSDSGHWPDPGHSCPRPVTWWSGEGPVLWTTPPSHTATHPHSATWRWWRSPLKHTGRACLFNPFPPLGHHMTS